MGGKTPKASQVKKITFLAWPPKEGNLAFGMCSKGYETLVFSVMEVFEKSTTLYSYSFCLNKTFSIIAPNLIAL